LSPLEATLLDVTLDRADHWGSQGRSLFSAFVEVVLVAKSMEGDFEGAVRYGEQAMAVYMVRVTSGSVMRGEAQPNAATGVVALPGGLQAPGSGGDDHGEAVQALRSDSDEQEHVAASLARFLSAPNSTRSALVFMRDDGAGRVGTADGTQRKVKGKGKGKGRRSDKKKRKRNKKGTGKGISKSKGNEKAVARGGRRGLAAISAAAASVGADRIHALADALSHAAVAPGEREAPLERWHERCQKRRIADLWLMHALVQSQVESWRASFGPEGPPPDAPAVLMQGLSLPMVNPVGMQIHGLDAGADGSLPFGIEMPTESMA